MGSTARCPTDNDLAEYAASPPGSGEIARHIDECAACRRTIAGIAAAAFSSTAHDPLGSDSGPASAPGAPLDRGARMGRYVVLERIGGGAMGTVYAAYDPELDRKIALKVLRADLGRGAGAGALRERLVREARVMARLSHPEVITVHDAGTFGEQVFIAMEFVGGGTMGTFLSRPRPFREILDVFLRAGRGLAAAHAAGLIHRDFKPENVLVGEDGRVRVTDFGLARAEALPPIDEAPASARAEPVDAHLTATGAIVGTPAYMAPEQHRGEQADARSDQFSFCVALYRALYGEPPFRGATLAELAKAVSRGEVREAPKGSRVPAWVRRALLRGLSAAPEARYPSMEALLADLARDPAVKRRRVALGAAVAVVVGAAATAGWAVGAFRDPCAHPERELAGAWDEGQKRRVSEAFLGTGRPYAADTVARVIAQLDRYGASWTTMRTEVCRASAKGRDEHREILGLRDACLDRRRGELQALTFLFAEKPDPQVLDRAVQAAGGLPPITSCADVEALTARVRPPEVPEARARVEALQPRADQLHALHLAGKYKDGLALSGPLLAEAEAAGYAPLRAQVQYWTGRLLEGAGEGEQAAALLRQAAVSAAEGKDDVLAALAWINLLFVVGEDLSHFEEASVIRSLGRTALARVQDEGLGAYWLRTEGVVLCRMEKYAESRAAQERALVIYERLPAPDTNELIVTLANLGNVLFKMGDYPLAVANFERALAMEEKMNGPGHPGLVTTLGNLASVLHATGRYERSRELQERALAIGERALGSDHPLVAATRYNMSNLLLDMDDPGQAVAGYERALVTFEKVLGPDNLRTTFPLTGLGLADVRLGRLDAAAPLLERALATREKLLGSAHSALSDTLLALGELDIARGKPAEAVSKLERSLALTQPGDRDEIRLTLAEALWRLGKDRPRARALAEQARADYERIGHRPGLDKATRWLAEHPG